MDQKPKYDRIECFNGWENMKSVINDLKNTNTYSGLDEFSYSVEERSKIIELIMLNIPLPTLYVVYHNSENKHVILGKIILVAINDFLNDEFKLTGLTVLKNLNGKKYSDNELLFDSGILRNNISFHYIRPNYSDFAKEMYVTDELLINQAIKLIENIQY